jgi:hypothetical protein
MKMEPDDEFDMTDEQFDQYMAEGELAVLVNPPGRHDAAVYFGKDSARRVVVAGNRAIEDSDVHAPPAWKTFTNNEVTA